ncbi:hypothetical protein [Coleofasciculus sp. G2-EDA-02]
MGFLSQIMGRVNYTAKGAIARPKTSKKRGENQSSSQFLTS